MKIENIAEVVERCKEKEEEAYNILYNNYVKQVYYICFKFLKNEQDALDVTQETFITVFEKITDLQQPESVGIWINRIATNKCKNILISKNRAAAEEKLDEETLIETEELDKDFVPEEYVINHEKRKIIMDIIDNKLSNVQRMVILLYYFERESVGEIAKIMDCSEGTVKSRLSSARKIIKQAIEEKEKKGYTILGVAPYLSLFSLLEADAKEQKLPSELQNFMKKINKQGNVKMMKKSLLVKCIGVGVVVAALGVSAIVLSNSVFNKDTEKDNVDEMVSDANDELASVYEENETDVTVNKWKYFDGDALDVTRFDINGWNKTIYINDIAYEMPLTVDSLAQIAGEEYNSYIIYKYTNGAGELISKSGVVELDETIAPYENITSFVYETNDYSSLFIENEEGSQLPGVNEVEVVFPEEIRFGDAFIREMTLGNFSYSDSERSQAILDMVKLSKDGKSLREMSYLDVIDELGQPSIYIDSYYLGYKYDDVALFFGFEYKSEYENYMCVEIQIGLEGSVVFDENFEMEYWNAYTPNQCSLLEE